MVSCNNIEMSTLIPKYDDNDCNSCVKCENHYTTNFQCDPNTNNPYREWDGLDGRGVTFWGVPSGISTIVPPGQTISIQFTPSVPRCYKTADNCNVFFNAHLTAATGTNATLTYKLNTFDAGHCILSGTGGGGYQAFELVNFNKEHYPEIWYKDNDRNTIKFGNPGNSTIQIEGLQMVRVYSMYALECDFGSGCNLNCYEGYQVNQGHSTDPSGDFATRQDYPCNRHTCGYRSYSYGHDEDFGDGQWIPAGDCRSWVFDWTDYSDYNFVAGTVCLFNFNAISGSTGQASIPLEAYLNGQQFATYILSNITDGGFAPSANLNTVGSYHDAGLNTIVLKNVSGTSVKMHDVAIDIYRIYETECACAPCESCQWGCELCQECETSCYMGQGCFPCYGFCMTCVTACELCESGYDWNEFCQSGFTWPCEVCESQCYTSCITCQPCEGCQACEYACQGCEITCEVCQPCENCQSGCLTCEPGCYDCQSCYSCEPSCYDFQICYLCQENCYDCETCYNLQ